MYLPFSRQPDYFDSEIAPAIIKWQPNELIEQGGKVKVGSLVAVYSEFGKQYAIVIDSAQYASQLGKKVEVIYELSNPHKAVINKLWGYWLIPIELAWSFGFFFILLGIAYATTHRPHPSAIAEQLKAEEGPKKKYE